MPDNSKLINELKKQMEFKMQPEKCGHCTYALFKTEGEDEDRRSYLVCNFLRTLDVQFVVLQDSVCKHFESAKKNGE